MRKRIYDVIEVSDTGGIWSTVYDYFMIAVILISLVPLASKEVSLRVSMLDHITAVIFIIDYLLRLCTADFKYGKKTASSFLRYPFSFYAVIDLLSILPLLTVINSGFDLLRLLRVLREFRLFRALRTLRYSRSISIIVEAFRKQKTPLLAVASLALGYILISALLVFNVEPDTFPTFFDAVYFATTSLATLGYGDIYPVTLTGRIVTMTSALVGMALVALPAVIITAGYMSVLEGDKREEEESTT